MNLINQLGVLAISTRLQRLSDHIRKEGSMIYKARGIDFEPKWFPVLITLKNKSPLGIMDLAGEIGYAHPSVIMLVKEMEKQGLTASVKGKDDERKRFITLTAKAQEMITKMEPVWEKITAAMKEITDTSNNLMKAMEEVEQQLTKEGFYARTMRLFDEEQGSIRIVDYTPQYREAFKQLGIAWISKIFEVEDIDMKVLSDPEQYILRDGGAILMVLDGEKAIGTCSLMKMHDKTFELTKMTVDESYRGLKLGYKLGVATLEKAKAIGADKVELYSNRKGAAAAIELYRKLGFAEVPMDDAVYKRADIKMEIPIR